MKIFTPTYYDFIRIRDIGIFTARSQIILLILIYLLVNLVARIEFDSIGTTQMSHNSSDFGRYVFAPLYEEIIFRGIILVALLRVMSSIKAIILSSFLFGIWHIKNQFLIDPIQLGYQVFYAGCIIGPILAYITYRTQTIWFGVMLHAVNNAWAPFSGILFARVLEWFT